MRYYTARTNPTTPSSLPNIVQPGGPVGTAQCLLDILYSTRCAERQFGFAPRLASLWNLLPKVSWTEFDYAVFVYKLRLVAGLPACGPLTRKDADLIGTLSTSTSGQQATLGHFIRAHFDFSPTFVLGEKNPWSQGSNTDCLGVEATWGLQLNPSDLPPSARSLIRHVDFKVRDARGSANLASKVVAFIQKEGAMSFLTSSMDVARTPASTVNGEVVFQIGSLFDSAVNNHASAIANGWMTRKVNAPGSAQFAVDLRTIWAQYRPSSSRFPGSMTIETIKWLRGYENLKPRRLGACESPYSFLEKYRVHFYGDDQYGVRWDGNASVNNNTPWDAVGAPVYGLSQRMNIYTALRRKAATEINIASVRVPYVWGNSRPGSKAHEDDKQAWTLNAQVEMDAFKAKLDAYSAAFKAREDELAAQAAAEAARRQALQEGQARLIAKISAQGAPLDVAFNKVVVKVPTFLQPSVEPPPSSVLSLINQNITKGIATDFSVNPNVLVSDGLIEPTPPVLPSEPSEPAARSKPPIALLAAAAIGGYLLLKG